MNGQHYLETRNTYIGVRQGSVLATIMFNSYLRKIINHTGPYYKILMYADDIVIYYNLKDMDKLNITLMEGCSVPGFELRQQINLDKTHNYIKTKISFYKQHHKIYYRD